MALLLPAFHFLIAFPLLYHQQIQSWKYIPRLQTLRDLERAYPRAAEIHQLIGIPVMNIGQLTASGFSTLSSFRRV
jgi:hypothetical protein